jgi:hypothetical protein
MDKIENSMDGTVVGFNVNNNLDLGHGVSLPSQLHDGSRIQGK